MRPTTQDVLRAFARSPAIRGGSGDRAMMAIKSGELTDLSSGRYRVTFFGLDGPHGHVTRDTDVAIAAETREHIESPVAPMGDDEVIAWTSTEEFVRGSKITAFTQAENALRWRAGRLGRYDWALPRIDAANDIGTRHGTVNVRGKPYDPDALDAGVADIEHSLRELEDQKENPMSCTPCENPAPRRWWEGPAPARAVVCYPTKTAALRMFLDTNSSIIQNYGGVDYQVSPSEFDSVNHKYGLTGKKAARTIAEAVWAAMPTGKPYCLDRLDLDALNDTSPAREAGTPFVLPSVVYEKTMAAGEHAGELEPGFITEFEPIEPPPPEGYEPYRVRLIEQEPGVAHFQFNPARASLGMRGPFRVTLFHRGERGVSFQRRDLRTALRDAVAEILGTGGDEARIYSSTQLVAQGHLHDSVMQGGDRKFTVRFIPVALHGEEGRRVNPDDPAWARGIDMTESHRLAATLHRPQEEIDRKERTIESDRWARLPVLEVDARTGREAESTTPRGVYVYVSSPGIGGAATHAVADMLAASGERVLAREPRYVKLEAGQDPNVTADRVIGVLAARHYRVTSRHPLAVENPPWVTSLLAKHLVELEDSVPPQWLPKLTRPRAERGKLTATMKEHGCGAYGCVLPTLDPSVVLKVTTDDTEAQFANELASNLAAPIAVRYRLVRALPEQHKGRPTFLLWRDAADRVGEIIDAIKERGGDWRAASDAIGEQHESAQAAFLALHEGRSADRLLEQWAKATRTMGRIPELRELAIGMIENLHKSSVFMGDVHAGNLGMVGGKWVVVDPGHVAVLE